MFGCAPVCVRFSSTATTGTTISPATVGSTIIQMILSRWSTQTVTHTTAKLPLKLTGRRILSTTPITSRMASSLMGILRRGFAVRNAIVCWTRITSALQIGCRNLDIWMVLPNQPTQASMPKRGKSYRLEEAHPSAQHTASTARLYATYALRAYAI